MSDGSHRETSNPLWKPRLETALQDYADINWRIGYTEGMHGSESQKDAESAEIIRQVILLMAGKG